MTKFHHTSLSVKSIPESQAFYENVFGFKKVSEGKRPEMKATFVNLEGEDGVRIELFEHDNPQVLKEDLMDFAKNGYKHLAFSVDNLEETIAKALRHGATIIWDIKLGITVKRIAFIADPNGLPIELLELND